MPVSLVMVLSSLMPQGLCWCDSVWTFFVGVPHQLPPVQRALAVMSFYMLSVKHALQPMNTVHLSVYPETGKPRRCLQCVSHFLLSSFRLRTGPEARSVSSAPRPNACSVPPHTTTKCVQCATLLWTSCSLLTANTDVSMGPKPSGAVGGHVQLLLLERQGVLQCLPSPLRSFSVDSSCRGSRLSGSDSTRSTVPHQDDAGCPTPR